jgi:hypothetical protein
VYVLGTLILDVLVCPTYDFWHGQKNIKLSDAKQVYEYKNTKIKVYKNNATVWYNKMCKAKQLIPAYANIKIKGDNPKCQRTKNAAVHYRINQELKFQYAKKQQLNEQLYKIHLEYASLWPTNWHLIQSALDSNFQQERDSHYNHLTES